MGISKPSFMHNRDVAFETANSLKTFAAYMGFIVHIYVFELILEEGKFIQSRRLTDLWH